MRRRSTTRTAALLGAGAALGTAGALALALPASAHNYIVSSSPGDGETLTALPAEFSATTNDTLLDVTGEGAQFAFQVRDASGGYYGDGCVEIVDGTMSTAAAIGEPGDYTVGYQFVSADGHTVTGEYGFTWAPAGDYEASEPSAEAPVCGVTPAVGSEATESPEAEPTDGASDDATSDAAPVETASPAPGASGDTGSNDALWIIGALIAVVVGAGGVLFAVFRPKSKAPGTDDSAQG
jgi:copper resistance protein C